jgi:hypothetical protein
VWLVREENTYLAAKNPDNRCELQITSKKERGIEEVEKNQLTRTLKCCCRGSGCRDLADYAFGTYTWFRDTMIAEHSPVMGILVQLRENPK